jgi:hypothetical protein
MQFGGIDERYEAEAAPLQPISLRYIGTRANLDKPSDGGDEASKWATAMPPSMLATVTNMASA